MRVPLAWLRDYVDLPEGADEIVARLAALGFPVDDVETRPTLTNVVVGRIVKLEPHPNADRLQLCTLDVGAAATLLIATAATNVAAGQIVPVARIGAQLAGGLTIAPRKMRGIDSEGMLISAEEVGLPGEWFEDGIVQLDPSIPLGTDFIAHFRLSEPVLEVDVTPNRPDALSILGLARELSASFGVPLHEPSSEVQYDGDSDDVRVTIETLDCKRFVFQRVSGVQLRPAPAWMRVRLALAGQRPINNVVDISNFVMLELGQPLHFFDWDHVAGKHLIVRDAKDGERFTTLDGQERTLDERAIVIADEAGPTSLAGIMGGQRSEVEDGTTEVLIEAATWTGPRIRRASIALKLRTEASARFEKSLSLALADVGAARAAHLLAREGGRVAPPRAAGQPVPEPGWVSVGDGVVRGLLGFDVSGDEAERVLVSLGFAVDRTGHELRVKPPYWRNDILIPADVVEEIARMVGYDRVCAEVPPVQPQDIDSAEFDRETELATIFAGLGYTETISLSLQPGSVAERWRASGIEIPTPLEILNPLSEDQRWMRFSLAPALLEFAARDRAARPALSRSKGPYLVFELGHRLRARGVRPARNRRFTVLHAGGESAFGRLKSDVLALLRRVTGLDARVERGSFASLHPGKTAALHIGETTVGYVGVVDPRLARAYEVADTTALGDVVLGTAARLRCPAIPRAVEVSAGRPRPRRPRRARRFGGRSGGRDTCRPAGAQRNPVRRIPRPASRGGKKSLALRIVLQSDEATLTDEAADTAMQRIIAALRERFGAEPRTSPGAASQ